MGTSDVNVGGLFFLQKCYHISDNYIGRLRVWQFHVVLTNMAPVRGGRSLV